MHQGQPGFESAARIIFFRVKDDCTEKMTESGF